MRSGVYRAAPSGMLKGFVEAAGTTLHYFKIRGARVNLGNLKSEFDRKQEIDEYQIVVQPEDKGDLFSMDELLIGLAPAKDSSGIVAEQIAAEVMRLINLRPRSEIAERDEIYNLLTATKPRRIVDARRQR